jgi:predicted ATP-grasp superfamily ATP-dependent carboligase
MIPAVCMGMGFNGVTLMGVVRSLARRGVPVCVFSHRQDSPARHSRLCQYRDSPDPQWEPDELERVLVDHARGLAEKPALFAVSDPELVFVSERQERLKQYYRIAAPECSFLRTLMDKRTQYRMVDGLGVAMPATYHDLTAAEARTRTIEYPVVIKPAIQGSWPYGRRKGLSVADAAELERELEGLERAGAAAVAQSYIPGPASRIYTVMAYISRVGEPIAWGTYRKVRQFPADFGLAAVAETVSAPALEQTALRLLRELGFKGVCGIEFKQDPRDGVFRFIELNPRFEMSNSLLACAGADMAWATYTDLAGIAPPVFACRPGVGWMALNLEWKACRERAARGEFRWRNWARSVRGVRAEALLAWDDPLPGLATYLGTMRNILAPGRKTAPGTAARGRAA